MLAPAIGRKTVPSRFWECPNRPHNCGSVGRAVRPSSRTCQQARVQSPSIERELWPRRLLQIQVVDSVPVWPGVSSLPYKLYVGVRSKPEELLDQKWNSLSIWRLGLSVALVSVQR